MRIPHYPRSILPKPHREPGSLSAIAALSPAWDATIYLLFRPFDHKQWIALSIVCLFLGGGTSTAAFQWGFSALPIDLHSSELIFQIRFLFAQHESLIVVAAAFTLGLIFALIYVRCVLRFVLIDAVVKQHTAAREAWRRQKSNGKGYFLWLTGIICALIVAAFAAVFISIRILSFIHEAGYPEWLVTAFLVVELVAVIATGLLVAVLITLTDDLVAPVIYAEGVSLPAAWKATWQIARGDHATFYLYVVVRFAIGMGISIGVLIILFPVLMGLSSVALLAAALLLVSMHMVGLAWVWNPITYVLAGLALGIFTSLIFALLSVIGMPGQVYLQDYGVRFMASRVQPLADLCVPPSPRARVH